MAIDLTHWVEHLLNDPAFDQYESRIEAEFNRTVQRLLDANDATPLAVAGMIGELRGLRQVMRLSNQLSRLARETE